MIQIYLDNNLGKQWIHLSNGYVKGYAYNAESFLLEGERLYSEILSHFQQDTLESFLPLLDGSFSLVLQEGERLLLIVDRMRSYPLFYSIQEDNNIVITDIGQNIRQYLNSLKTNEEAVYELLALGYLSGAHTLIQQVRSVETGSYVVIENGQATIHNYASYMPKDKIMDISYLNERAEDVLDEAFKRMLKTIEDRPILIPLSGGYDSRLIACLCKKFGLKDVTCFTYGRTDSFEVEISRKVADQLGFDWHFIEYNFDTWNHFIRSGRFKDYCLFAGNLTANPHFQDFPALEELNRRGILKSDMVVIPGHSGDLLGGSKIPIVFLENRKLELTRFFESHLIYDNFYNLNVLKSAWRDRLIKRIELMLGKGEPMGIDDFLDEYETWFIKAKVGNFLVNSMRGYEYFGLDWRLPLWDMQYERLWYSVPWKMKYYSTLYNQFMFQCYFDSYGVGYRKYKTVTNTDIANHLKRFLPKSAATLLRACIDKGRKLRTKKNINAFDAVVEILFNISNETKYTGVRSNKKNINAAIAYYYLSLYQGNYIKS